MRDKFGRFIKGYLPDGDKSNHRLTNLMASCQSCNSKIRFRPNNSKFYKLYNASLEKIGERIGFRESTISMWQKKDILGSIIKSNSEIFSIDKNGKVCL